MNYSIRSGRYTHDIFRVIGAASGSWTRLDIDESFTGAPVKVTAVYWDAPSAGAYLMLKDATDQIFFTSYHASGSLNYLTSPLTVKAPVQYFDSEGDNTISLYGQFC
jgi:hypothetical protein